MIAPEDFWIRRGENLMGLDYTHQAAVYKNLAETVTGLNGQIARVLDVGCNFGRMAEYLAAAGYNGMYLGIDSNPHAIVECKRRGFAAKLLNLRDLDKEFEPKIYDLIVMKDVLEHLESHALLRHLAALSPKFILLGIFIPWREGGGALKDWNPEGYFLNRYDALEVNEYMANLGYICGKVQEIQDDAGFTNETRLFVRKEQTRGGTCKPI